MDERKVKIYIQAVQIVPNTNYRFTEFRKVCF